MEYDFRMVALFIGLIFAGLFFFFKKFARLWLEDKVASHPKCATIALSMVIATAALLAQPTLLVVILFLPFVAMVFAYGWICKVLGRHES